MEVRQNGILQYEGLKTNLVLSGGSNIGHSADVIINTLSLNVQFL